MLPTGMFVRRCIPTSQVPSLLANKKKTATGVGDAAWTPGGESGSVVVSRLGMGVTYFNNKQLKFLCCNKAPVAQWIERLFPKQKAVGSTPTWRVQFSASFFLRRLPTH
jgi:hypothetical protein